jgi:aspartate aminotransferase-like enzyme
LLTKTIFTPGPTQVHPLVLKSITGHTAYHRSEEFKDFHKSLIPKLRKIFLTEHYINILTASGTGAMEAAVTNFCSPADKAIYINQGRFGGRWGGICKAYGIPSEEIHVNEGESVSIETINSYNFNEVNAVFLTHTETSTATVTDIMKIAELIRQKNPDTLIIVDSVTSVGAIEFRMDEWGIDVAVSASQKGLMTPPGLSIIAYSERAKEKMMTGGLSRFYFDLRKELTAQETFLTSWTPAIGLLYGIDTACDIILQEGLEHVWQRVSSMADYFRSQSVKNGFGLFSKSPSNALTAILMPEGISSGKLVKKLKQSYGIQIANGQGDLNGKIFRVSHMGDLNLEDTIELAAIIKKEFDEIL